MDAVAVRHKQIGTDQKAGTGQASVRIVPLRYMKPTDLGAKLVVLTLAREVPHLFKIIGTDDFIGAPLIFSEPVCQTKGDPEQEYDRQNVKFSQQFYFLLYSKSHNYLHTRLLLRMIPISNGLDLAKPEGFRKNTLDSRLPVLLYFQTC